MQQRCHSVFALLFLLYHQSVAQEDPLCHFSFLQDIKFSAQGRLVLPGVTWLRLFAGTTWWVDSSTNDFMAVAEDNIRHCAGTCGQSC